jgi:hypothetical protein
MPPATRTTSSTALTVLVWGLGGVLVAVAGWLLPVNLKSLTPAQLAAAGAGTPGVAERGQDLLVQEKLGPAALLWAAAKQVGDPGAEALGQRLARDTARQSDLAPWGGWDPFLDPLLRHAEPRTGEGSAPVLNFFITASAREALAGFLSGSRSAGVQALLAAREVDRTEQFVPARRSGGQALDAVGLLAALLLQGDHYTAAMSRELRDLAETAIATGELGALEPVLVDLLALGRRLDWVQLTELITRLARPRTLSEFAHLARVAGDDLPVIYAAALLADSADDVAAYLIRYGRPGLLDLRLALGHGGGAVRQLLLRQVPVNHDAADVFGAVAGLGLRYPGLLLALKYLCFLAGAFGLLRAVDRAVAARTVGGALPHLSSGLLATVAAALFIVATEPFLLRAAPASEFRVTFAVPVLSTLTDPASVERVPATTAMTSSTLLSIAFFACLQVGMYLICLMKIGQISRSGLPPLVRLRLMENEENLFDGGLYLGIAGTCAALVMQVLGLIEPNLLAAYSSNLFGIMCVALVKIRHVRPYKYTLILEAQDEIAVAPVARA